MAKSPDEIRVTIKERAVEIEAARRRPAEPSDGAKVEALTELVAEMLAAQPLPRDEILSLEAAAEQTPWSKKTLYREAPKPESPFFKRGGRWVVVRSDLLAWVRSGTKPVRVHRSESPMPRPRRRKRGGKLLADAEAMRRQNLT